MLLISVHVFHPFNSKLTLFVTLYITP